MIIPTGSGFIYAASGQFVKGTRLLNQDGVAVGSYENDVIILNEVYSPDVDIRTAIKIDGLHFDYSKADTAGATSRTSPRCG